jgi:hypothetical protein
VKPVLCGKITINFSMTQEEYDKLTPDQESAMTETAKRYVRGKVEAVIAEANEKIAHLGAIISVHEDL